MKDEKGTSWVGDARRLLQDFVAPELRAITARLEEADKRDAERDKLATERHLALLDKLDATRREIMLQVELAITKSRLQDLEGRQSAGTASTPPA